MTEPSGPADAAGTQPGQQAAAQGTDPGTGPAQPWMPDAPVGPPPSYATPGGYGTPGGGRNAGYGAPPGQQPYAAPQGQQAYGAPPGQQPSGYPQYPGYGTPPGQQQRYPGYPQQAGYGQYAGYDYRNPDPALAERSRRLAARMIDGLILAVVFSPLWYPPWHTLIDQVRTLQDRYPGQNLSAIPAASNALTHAEQHFIGRIFAVALLFYLIAFLYDWIQHAAWGQTIGKRALGTMVVTAGERGKVSVGAAGARAAVYALPGLVPLVGALFSLLNDLWLLWDPRRQCLHDKAAHTVVIKKNF